MGISAPDVVAPSQDRANFSDLAEQVKEGAAARCHHHEYE